ncbi:MAG: hypothetical protein ACJ76Y_10485 [Thermoanaerobaculia bacterium]
MLKLGERNFLERPFRRWCPMRKEKRLWFERPVRPLLHLQRSETDDLVHRAEELQRQTGQMSWVSWLYRTEITQKGVTMVCPPVSGYKEYRPSQGETRMANKPITWKVKDAECDRVRYLSITDHPFPFNDKIVVGIRLKLGRKGSKKREIRLDPKAYRRGNLEDIAAGRFRGIARDDLPLDLLRVI